MFYNSKKNILFYIIFFIFINNTTDYIKNVLSIECINQENIVNYCTKNYIFAHNKFCKVVNFYFHTEERLEDNNKKKLQLTLLMLYNDDNEVEIMPHDKVLKNEFQWHIQLNDQYPQSIKKKEKDLNDEILFGKNHIHFGEMYIVDFEIQDIDNKNYTIHLLQPHRKIHFCI